MEKVSYLSLILVPITKATLEVLETQIPEFQENILYMTETGSMDKDQDKGSITMIKIRLAVIRGHG